MLILKPFLFLYKWWCDGNITPNDRECLPPELFFCFGALVREQTQPKLTNLSNTDMSFKQKRCILHWLFRFCLCNGTSAEEV